MNNKPLVRFAAAALAAMSLAAPSGAGEGNGSGTGEYHRTDNGPRPVTGYTKADIIPKALERFERLRARLDNQYPDQNFGATVRDARNKFDENAKAVLPELGADGQPKRYGERELWVMERLVDEQVRAVEEGAEVMVDAKKFNRDKSEVMHALATVQSNYQNRVRQVMSDSVRQGSDILGGAGRDAFANGAGNGVGGPGGDLKKSPLVVLALESTTCAMTPESCKITIPPPPVVTAPPVATVPSTPVKPDPVKPTSPVNPVPVPSNPGQPAPPKPDNSGPDVDQIVSGIAHGIGGPSSINSMTSQGVLQFQRGRYSEALDMARTALSYNPKDANALNLLHQVNGRVEGGAVGAAGGAAATARAAALGGGGAGPGFASDASSARPSAEISALATSGAMRLAANEALAKARSAMELKDNDSALDGLSKALQQDPNNPALLNMRATVYGRLGRWEDALKDANAALALAPGNMALLTTKSIAENRTRRWTDALATANEMLSVDPNNAWAFAARAHAYGGLGRKDDMMRDILRAAALDAKFQKAATDAANLQLPSDADVMFLFPGEGAKGAAQPAPAAAGRGKTFGLLVGAGIGGGLLLALGLLSIVMDPVKKAVTSVFTKRSPVDPRSAVATAQPASVAGEVGGLIRGQYEISRQIGVGGMGMVYEGTDKSLGRRVAIKKMREELRLNARERDRFIIEAKTVASLHHPNIVDIYAIAEEGDDVFLVFEYVDGKTVHDLVQTSGRLEPAEAVGVTRAMGEALTYAHSRGVIHRDMKPSNVMRTKSGQIKVMDFGIARMAKDALTRYSMTNTVVGTPPYMAPEQEQGVVRKESDVYALAICAYEMLTGKLPFIGMGAGMLMNKINMSYIPPSRAIAGLPEALDEVFLKAFQADPEKRYRTPQEFVAALGGSIGARAKT